MRKILLVIALVSTVGCAIPTSIGGRSTAQLTTPGIQAMHTVEVVKALDLVRDIAIDGEVAKIIPTATARIVVQAHKSMIDVIRATPDGWKASVLAALGQLSKNIPANDVAQFGPYISAATNIIKAVIQ